MMSLLWIILPYSAFLSFVLGHVWRYRHDRFSSYISGSEVDRAQHFGAAVFRIGIGLLVVVRVADMFLAGPHSRIGGAAYAAIVVIEVSGLALATLGAVLVFVPDMIGGTSRPAVTWVDRFTFPLMVAGVLSWAAIKFDPNSAENGYRTAETLFTWFRSLISAQPNPAAMDDAPLVYQVRGLIIVLFIGIWPYTRLAGIAADPIRYLLRWRGRTPAEAVTVSAGRG